MRSIVRLLPLAALLALCACAPAPIYRPSAQAVAATPFQVAQSPGRYTGGDVIWGGRIVQVDNLPDRSEVQILAYPLDGSQRPKAGDSGNGRFIAVLHGFVEPLSYPPGALVTVSGRLEGSETGKVGEAGYVFPRVAVGQSHVWTREELSQGRSNIQFGVGVGIIR